MCVAKANEIINAGSADQTEQLTEGFLREEEGVKEEGRDGDAEGLCEDFVESCWESRDYRGIERRIA